LLVIGVGALSPRVAVAQPCEAGWLPGPGRDTINPETFTKAENFAAHPSGDMIISGHFRPGGDWPHHGIVRYNPVTNTFIQMGGGTNGWNEIAVLPDGDVVCWDLPVGGPPMTGMARYNFQAEVWSSIGTTRPQSVSKMQAASDGSLLVSGTFTSIGSLAVSGIARLDTDTGEWSVLGQGLNGSVASFAVSSDGVVFASGGFTASGAIPLHGVATFDPVVEVWSQLPGSTHAFTQIEVGANSDLYGVRSVSSRGVAFRYDRVGQTWTILAAASVPSNSVSRIAVRPDGALVGLTSNGACIFDPATDAWVPLGSMEIYGGFCIGVAWNNDVFVGGHLGLGDSAYGNLEGVVRYQEQIGEWTHIGRGLDDRVTEIVDADDGTFWIGGRFRTVDGKPAGRVARLDPAQGVISPMHPSPFFVVDAMLTSPHFGLVVGSTRQATFDGSTNRRVWSFDEAAVSWRKIGSVDYPSQIPWDGVSDLLSLPDGDLLALGPSLTRLNASTGVWSRVAYGSFETGLVLPSGGVVIAGQRVQLFDPDTNQMTDLAPGPNVAVRSLALLPDGDLLVGGRFTLIGGVAVRSLARYNFEASSWSNFGGGVVGSIIPSVNAVRVSSDGRVLVAGSFTQIPLAIGYLSANNIAEFDLVTNTWRSFGSGLEGGIAYSIHPTPDGGFLAGGEFSRAGGLSSPYLARWASANPPAILQQPRPALLCSGGEITMSFGVGSTREAAFRWQWQPPASSEWLDLVDGDNLVGDVPVLATTGVNRRTISASALEGLPAESPIQLRCIAITPCGEVTSDAASLTLRAPCACYDFNRDLEIDLADAHDMAAVFTGLRLSEPNWLDGDLNGDENADLTDAQLLAAYVVSGNCGV
jgi:hypothetical protein